LNREREKRGEESGGGGRRGWTKGTNGTEGRRKTKGEARGKGQENLGKRTDLMGLDGLGRREGGTVKWRKGEQRWTIEDRRGEGCCPGESIDEYGDEKADEYGEDAAKVRRKERRKAREIPRK